MFDFERDATGKQSKTKRGVTRGTKPSCLQPRKPVFGGCHSDNLGSRVLVVNRWAKGAPGPSS